MGKVSRFCSQFYFRFRFFVFKKNMAIEAFPLSSPLETDVKGVEERSLPK